MSDEEMTNVSDDTTQAEETAEASSAENQTDETHQEESPQENSDQPVKTVPYERFKEVNSSKNELKKEIESLKSQLNEIQAEKTQSTPPNPQEEQIKQQLDHYLKELGYVSKKELEQVEADRELQNTIQELEKKYNGKDGRPKFSRDETIDFARKNLIGNLEIAYKQMHEAELMDYAIKKAMGKTKAVRSEKSDGSGSADVGTTQDDLYRSAVSGDEDALHTLIKRSIS